MGKEMKCKICNDNGECLNDDIYDCVEYLEVQNGIPKGQWMVDWMRRLKDEEPYISDFVKWSKTLLLLIQTSDGSIKLVFDSSIPFVF